MSTKRVYDCVGSHATSILKKIYAADDFDIKLSADSKEIPAHKLILSANSDYFKSMFSGNYRETQMEKIAFQDVDGIALEACVRFCYLGQIEFTADNVFDVISTAILMQFNAIEKGGWKFLIDTISPQNVLEVIAFADLHGRRDLVENSLKYALKKIGSIIQLPNFQRLDKEHIIAFIKQAKSLGIVSDSEMLDVFNSWINVNQVERLKETKHFLSCFDLEKASVQFIWTQIRPFCRDTESRDIFEEVMSLHLLSGEKLGPSKHVEKEKILQPSFPKVEAKSDFKLPRHNTTKLVYMNEVLMRLTIEDQHCLYSFCPVQKSFTDIACLDNKIGYQNLRWGNRILDFFNKSLRQYDLVSGEWTIMPKIDGGMVYFCVIDNELYSLSPSFCVYKHDSKSNVWTIFGFPYENRKNETGAMFVSLNKKLYIIGGCNVEFPVKCFDFKTRLWSNLAKPLVSRCCLRLVACKGYIYAFGGSVTGSVKNVWTKNIEKYDPIANMWTKLPDWSQNYSPLFVSCANDQIYIITTQHEVVSFNTNTNSVCAEGNFKTMLNSHSAVVINS